MSARGTVALAAQLLTVSKFAEQAGVQTVRRMIALLYFSWEDGPVIP
jgi:hypothetical protein